MQQQPGGGYDKHGKAVETLTLAAVAALGVEAILPYTGAPGWVLPWTEVITTSGAALVTWSFTGRKLFPFYLTSLGLFVGAWSAYAGKAGMWHWNVLGLFLAGMGALIPAGVWAWHRRHPKAAAPGPAMLTAVPEPLMLRPEPTENDVQRELFAGMFADFNIYAGKVPGTDEKIPVDVTELTSVAWGRQVRIALPRSGEITIDDFEGKKRNLEVALRVQEGAVSFERGAHSGDIVMKIRERDGLAQSTRITPELRPRSVNDEIIIGIQEDGTFLKMPVREIHAMIVGMTGAGKSNLINVIIAQLAACPDTVIWAIDMKGGRAIRPWFQAWEEAKVEAPPIDWLATTREEAELMLNAVNAAIEVRMKSGIGRSKIKPTAGMPQIILITDEMADLFGDAGGFRTELGDQVKSNQWFIRQAGTVTQKGRSEAVATMWASQRGTTSMGGSTDMRANMQVKIALRPSKASEMEWIVPDLPAMAKRQLQYLAKTPGVGIMGLGPHASQPTKFLWHDHIEDVCGEDPDNPVCPPECPVYQSQFDVAPVRPRLDKMTADALGAPYAQRWVRAKRDGILMVPDRVLAGGSAMHGFSGDPSRFEDVISGLEDPEEDLHPGQVRMREILSSRGEWGYGVKDIYDKLNDEGIAPARETLHRWLNKDMEAGLVHHPGYRRWVTGPGANVKGE